MPITITFNLPVKIVKKEKWYVSSCPMLDVFSQGDTEDHARNNLIDALSLFLTSCFDNGTLEAVLKECGFEFRPTSIPVKENSFKAELSSLSAQTKLIPLRDKEEYINVPISLIAAGREVDSCHA